MDAHVVRQQMRKERQHQRGVLGDPDVDHGLSVFAYSAKVYTRLEPACSDANLIALGHDNGGLADRFDVRHLLPPGLQADDPMVTLHAPELHSTRFGSLDGAQIPEHEVFQMDALQRRKYIASIRHPQEIHGGGAQIPLEYNTGIRTTPPGPSPHPDPVEFEPPFAVPDEMSTPRTQRHFAIIEQTARFISEQPADRAAHMEIHIQGRQGTSADFEFLNRTSHLHGFYKHLVWLMHTGLYAYNQSESNSSEDEAAGGSEQKAESPPAPSGNQDLNASAAPLESQEPSASAAPLGNQEPKASLAPSSDKEVKAKRRQRAMEFLRRKRLKE